MVNKISCFVFVIFNIFYSGFFGGFLGDVLFFFGVFNTYYSITMFNS